MSTQGECFVCTDEFNNSNRKKVSCPSCDFACCRGCCQNHILSKPTSVQCMNCKTEWSRTHILSQFPKTFVNDTGNWKGKGLRTHQENILLTSEQSFIPDTISIIEREKYLKSLRDKERSIRKDFNLIEGTVKSLRRERFNNCSCKKGPKKCVCVSVQDREDWLEENYQLVEIRKELEKKSNLALRKYYSELLDKGKQEKQPKAFIQKCMVHGCDGYLSTKWKCQVCNTQTCNRCREVKEEGHVCNEDTVKTILMCVKESKPCPKCREPISKINGCDQMWCSLCETVFSWNTGKIQVGGWVHQPDAVQRMRERGLLARHLQDIQCGGIPHFVLARGRFSTKQYNILFPIVSRFQRLGMEYEQYGMNNEPPNAFNRHLISRKKFLEGKMNEKEWKRKLFLNEKVLSKEEEERLILGGWYICFADLLRGLTTIVTYDKYCSQIIDICKLFDLYNNIFKKQISDIYNNCAYIRFEVTSLPTIVNNSINWNRMSFVHRIKRNQKHNAFFPNIKTILDIGRVTI